MSEFVEQNAPKVGDLVIGVVKRVERYGAYLDLVEYPGWEGLVHISEISLKWIRNIRDYLRENQKEVFKVLRVDRNARQADVSLRRVSHKERESKMLLWKRKQKLTRILSLLSERSGQPIEKLHELIVEPAIKRGLSLYDVFLESVDKDRLPNWMKLDKDLSGQLLQLIKQEIKLKQAVARGTLMMLVPKGDGIEVIREAVKKGLGAAERGSRVTITTIGAPKYLIRVEAEDQEKARRVLEKVAERCLSIVREAGGRGELQPK
ncbi:MAG: S1 RNA-binding domain-containing protein [Thaumarchaeota archaeon]|nr:S1 RNA-binding domain-containing protein [Nitrososphaerota archaeon]